MRADQIKQGDVLAATESRPRRVVIGCEPDLRAHNVTIVTLPILKTLSASVRTASETWRDDHDVAIEPPRAEVLTPVQRRADELAGVLIRLYQVRHKHITSDDPAWSDVAELLDSVRPAAPTLDEVLHALVVQFESTGPGSSLSQHDAANTATRAMLDRARRAGLLKGGE